MGWLKVVSKLTKGISKALDINNFNILNNCGEIAGQTVNHFHIHIIPRIENDNIKIELSSNKLTDMEFDNLRDKLYNAINN